ncbi:replication factor-A carboxy-terminal domain protein [Spatholobus suberectus]|nr:replication factor-A carboxy-terminal domain protein [Spatholobus suberectus]
MSAKCDFILQNELKVGSVYYTVNFGIANNVGAYRTTRHTHKLNFQFGAEIKKASNDLYAE